MTQLIFELAKPEDLKKVMAALILNSEKSI